MKSLTALLICLAASLMVVSGTEPSSPRPALEGKWRVIHERLEKNGLVVVWEFTATEIIVRDGKTGEEISRSRYTIDTTKMPNWITIERDDSPTGDSGDKRLGIFRIQGDELHLKQEITDGGERPAKIGKTFLRFQRLAYNSPQNEAPKTAIK